MDQPCELIVKLKMVTIPRVEFETGKQGLSLVALCRVGVVRRKQRAGMSRQQACLHRA